MRCKRCDYDNGPSPPLEPVYRETVTGALSDEAPVGADPQPFYARWACEKCGRYHFPDGTLYSNPFRSETA